jgi:hypothetical protein
MLSWPAAVDGHGNEILHTLTLSDGAYSEWLAFARLIESRMRPGAEFEHATDWAGKAAGAAARIAGVLHGIEHASSNPWVLPISTDTMQSALSIAAVFSQHSLAALDMMGADPEIEAARKVWDWIKRNRRESFSVRDAQQALKGTFKHVKDLRAALDILAERGYLVIFDTMQSGPGRPSSPIVRVRDDLAEAWR